MIVLDTKVIRLPAEAAFTTAVTRDGSFYGGFGIPPGRRRDDLA